ncbi:hypothetical protein ACT3RP_04450 [Halomonas sp. AOP5-B2-8]
MTQEVIRRHYLDAMGITAWAAKYQLPNALPTEACEWEESAPAPTPPRERLQALLDDAPAPRRAAPELSVPGDVTASPSAIRALLTNDQPGQAKHAGEPPVPAALPDSQPAEAVAAPDAAPAKPLAFSLSCLCVDGRWLVLHAGEMSTSEQQLLINLLYAAGIQPSVAPSITHFTWPQMTNAFAVEDPLDEAREGLAAFVAGRVNRQGWQLEQLLWWGALGADQGTLDRVLNVADGQSHTLSLPVWQGPALASLLDNTNNKRDLWPELQLLGQQWASVSPADTPQAADDY